MTITEFQQQRHSLTCRDCGQQALTTERNPNNNALQVVCPACQSRRPLGGRVTNLKQTTTKRRKEYPAGESLDEVWQRFGDRCVVCSAPKEFLIKLGIGRQRQHVAEYARHGHSGPLVPMCVPCHENATQRQKFFWFVYRTVLQQRENEQQNDEQTTTSDGFELRP